MFTERVWGGGGGRGAGRGASRGGMRDGQRAPKQHPARRPARPPRRHTPPPAPEEGGRSCCIPLADWDPSVRGEAAAVMGGSARLRGFLNVARWWLRLLHAVRAPSAACEAAAGTQLAPRRAVCAVVATATQPRVAVLGQG